MTTALAAALAVTLSTAARFSPPGDASWSAALPGGYALSAATEPASLRLADSGGNTLRLTALGPTSPLLLDAAAYDELKVLETRLSAPGRDCASTPLHDVDLGHGRAARSAEGACGAGGVAYAVVASSVDGRMFLASAEGRAAPAAELMGSVAIVQLEPLFRVFTREPLPPLSPLPPRAHRTQYRALMLGGFAAFMAFVFFLRALPGLFARFFPPAEEPAASPGGAFPIFARRLYGRLPFRFEVEFETGDRFIAVSDRKPSVMISWGSTFLTAYALQTAADADSVLRGQTLFASVLLLAAGNIYLRITPRKLNLLDSNDHPVITIVEPELSLSEPRGEIFLDGEATPFSLRRRRAEGRRLWELLDAAGTAVLTFVEDSPSKAKTRRVFGHLWGALRTEYALTSGGRVVGGLKRTWSVWNALRLDMVPIAGLDPRIVAAAAMFIERVDPDRWHPWPV